MIEEILEKYAKATLRSRSASLHSGRITACIWFAPAVALPYFAPLRYAKHQIHADVEQNRSRPATRDSATLLNARRYPPLGSVAAFATLRLATLAQQSAIRNRRSAAPRLSATSYSRRALCEIARNFFIIF